MRTLGAACAASALLLCCTRREPAGAGASPTAAGLTAAEGTMAPARKGATATVRFETPRGPWLVEVELARTPEERARGLMFRTALAPDHGMLFVFEETAERSFWMHDTLLSLDMIFLGDDRVVAGVVADATPRTDTPRTVHRPSRYVVEVVGGEARAHAVGPGARASFIGVEE
ncbi:MAG TPA: DUF192 domain-containing protein [Myxococcales bacterium]|jgi:uncharacterized membrane protein (UPF0127 family)|nr:DUF192 domain-containing protein [Myxococcales bacterium]